MKFWQMAGALEGWVIHDEYITCDMGIKLEGGKYLDEKYLPPVWPPLLYSLLRTPFGNPMALSRLSNGNLHSVIECSISGSISATFVGILNAHEMRWTLSIYSAFNHILNPCKEIIWIFQLISFYPKSLKFPHCCILACTSYPRSLFTDEVITDRMSAPVSYFTESQKCSVPSTKLHWTAFVSWANKCCYELRQSGARVKKNYGIRQAGFEPITLGSVSQRSYQLSYPVNLNFGIP